MSRAEQFLLGAGHNREAVQVALVNNMPDAAMRATELQFARLLKDAAGPLDVRLRLFSLGTIARSEEARARMAGFYDDAAFLQAANIDALIITGAQPCTADLREESYWPEMTQLIDWAETGTVSTLFSCLAAHGAVLHLDGIERRALPQKLSGIYDSSRAEDDPLFFNTRPSVPVPHSRRNDIAESDLVAGAIACCRGFTTARWTSSPASRRAKAVLSFSRAIRNMIPATLGREYLRDMARFLRGETDEGPAFRKIISTAPPRTVFPRSAPAAKPIWPAARRSWRAPCRARPGAPIPSGCSQTG